MTSTIGQPTPLPRSAVSNSGASRAIQIVLGIVLIGGGLYVLGLMALEMFINALGRGFAAGCCGGGSGGSGGTTSVYSLLDGMAALIAIAYGFVLFLSGVLNWPVVKVSLWFFGVAGVLAAVVLFGHWSREREIARAQALENATRVRWQTDYKRHIAAVEKAIEADNPEAVEVAGKACVELVQNVPSRFGASISGWRCLTTRDDYRELLNTAFTANAWRVVDHYLNVAEKRAEASGTWDGKSLRDGVRCHGDLANREDDAAPWLIGPGSKDKITELREAGAVAPLSGSVPTDMLNTLARHRGPPSRAGEGALQRLFQYALTQRRMDVVAAISAQVEGKFRWCTAGLDESLLLDAIRPSHGGRLWPEGETALFSALQAWPLKRWHQLAQEHLYVVANSGWRNQPETQVEAVAACKRTAARLAASRTGSDLRALLRKCQVR